MSIIIPLAVLIAIISAIPIPPKATPKDLAQWADCSPPRIAYAVAQSIHYKEVPQWETGQECLTRGYGDCKCMAVIAKESLMTCEGYSPRIVVLVSKQGKPRYHAITVYTRADGKRGFINGGAWVELPKDTDWNEVIKRVLGGPWEVYNNG